MSVLGRYVLGRCMAASFLSLAVLLGVVLALFFTELLADAAGGDFPARMMLSLLGLRIPEALLLVAPLALMTGVLLAVGRLHQQSELTVMRGSGWSAARLARPLLVLVAAWGLVMLLVSGWVSPQGARTTAGMMETAAQEALVTGLTPGHFQRLDRGRLHIYIERAGAGGGELEDIFIHRRLDDGRAEVTTAASGRFWVDGDTGARYLTLLDGRQVEHGDGAENLRRLNFARNDLRLPPPAGAEGVDPREQQWLHDLSPTTDSEQAAEWHWRLASPIAAIVLGLLALPLSLGPTRRPHHGRVVAALVLYLVYSYMINLGLLAIEQGRVPAALGLWPVHLAVAAMAALAWHGVRRKW